MTRELPISITHFGDGCCFFILAKASLAFKPDIRRNFGQPNHVTGQDKLCLPDKQLKMFSPKNKDSHSQGTLSHIYTIVVIIKV